MDSLGPQDQTPIRRRTGRKEYGQHHKRFLELMAQGKNPVEIRSVLGISINQYRRHLVEAIEAGALSNSPEIKYAVIRFGALQQRDREEFTKRLQLAVDDSALLKFENRGDEIICTIIPAAETTSAEEGSDQ